MRFVLVLLAALLATPMIPTEALASGHHAVHGRRHHKKHRKHKKHRRKHARAKRHKRSSVEL